VASGGVLGQFEEATLAGQRLLGLAYPLGDGRRLDADGRPASPRRGQEVTKLHDADAVLAEVAHAPGLLDDPSLVGAIASAARLALHNERLHAELRARLEDLRAMRGRIVSAGDAERRQLERDLHDGAQQRLATLAVSLEVARMRATSDRESALALAHADVRAALAALRTVAHGLVPPVLADEGLARAVEAFAETADAEVWVPDPLPADRFAPELEATAGSLVL